MSRWSEDKSLVFVQHYEKYRSLWDPSYKDYRNRDIRNQAIKLLSTDMECSGITMTTDDVKNRIKSIRTTYAAEKRKIEKSKKSGSSSDDIYQPSCSWYEVADRFLRKSATIRPVFENLDLNSQISSPMMSTSYQDHIDSGPEENEGNCSTQNQTGYVSSKINNKKKRRQNPTIEAVNKLEKIYESSRTDLTEDEYDIFGKHIAANLRKLSVLRALDAQEKINAILLNARKLELTTPSSMNQTTRRKDRFSFDCSGVLNDHAAPLYETQPSTQSSIVLNDHSAPFYETQPNTQSSKVLTDHAVVLYGTQQNIQSSKAIQDHAAIYGTQSSKPGTSACMRVHKSNLCGSASSRSTPPNILTQRKISTPVFASTKSSPRTAVYGGKTLDHITGHGNVRKSEQPSYQNSSDKPSYRKQTDMDPVKFVYKVKATNVNSKHEVINSVGDIVELNDDIQDNDATDWLDNSFGAEDYGLVDASSMISEDMC